MTQFTASEVRRTAAAVEGKQMLVSSMLRAFADRLDADDKAVPLAWLIEYDFNPASAIVTNSKAVVDGLRSERNRIAPLYTHSAPSDAERLAEALRHRIRNLRLQADTSASNGDNAGSVVRRIVAEALERDLQAHSAQAQKGVE